MMIIIPFCKKKNKTINPEKAVKYCFEIKKCYYFSLYLKRGKISEIF